MVPRTRRSDRWPPSRAALGRLRRAERLQSLSLPGIGHHQPVAATKAKTALYPSRQLAAWPLQGWCGDLELQRSRGALRVLAVVGSHKCQSGQCDCWANVSFRTFWFSLYHTAAIQPPGRASSSVCVKAFAGGAAAPPSACIFCFVSCK